MCSYTQLKWSDHTISPDFWKWKKSTFNECVDLDKLELSQAYNHPDLYLFFKRHELKE